jgi:isocitrate/isopropylmalate dehydrogenase
LERKNKRIWNYLDLCEYSEEEIARIAHLAFKSAQKEGKSDDG